MATQLENLCATPTQAQAFSTPPKDRPHPTSIAKVRVILRLRPFLSHEISSRHGHPVSCVSIQESDTSSEDEVTVLLKDQETSRNECYNLDGFFGQDDNNVSQIFEREVKPLIPSLFQGYNATVFAYGATGSGKTYTMQGNGQLPGIMHLAMANILSMCKCRKSSVSVSYYEIYLERCYDLLEPKEKEILILDDKDGHMHLKGLAQIEVNSIEKFHEVFNSALQGRKIARTGLNDISSRSHGVLVITVSTPSHESGGNNFTGKLSLIDLAGNEDNRRVCNEGIRLQESTKINQSLFALSNVIYALNNSKPRVPYRDSKLTRVLQDSLGGTSRSLMVACLNPGEYQESVHTVSLAARSRHVSNFICTSHKNANSKMRVDMEAKLQAWLESKGKTKSAQRIYGSPFHGRSRTPCSVKPVRNTFTPSTGTKSVRNNERALDSKERRSCKAGRNLFQGGVYADCRGEVQNLSVAETDQVKIHFPVSVDASKSNPALPEPFDRENDIRDCRTPLKIITDRSSNLKASLLQDYLEFLNTASRDELMELKGIGQKMADYIIELRKTSPLKSLGDIEKIGLSSKQVHNMFGKAARGLLEDLKYNA